MNELIEAQQRQIEQLTDLVTRLVDVMDRQTDAIGKLVAIALTPNEAEDKEDGPHHVYLDPSDDTRHKS